MPRTRRTRLATGIYRDTYGHAIIVKRHGRAVEKRYPPDKPLGWLKNERERLIATLDRKGPRGHQGTLAGDVEAFLRQLPEGRPKQDMAHWLSAWLPALGTTPREAITTQMARHAMAGWRVQDRLPGPSTQNHRRHALRALYKALDGPDAPTPCDDIGRTKERKQMRVVPRGVVLAVLRRLPPCATTARLKVLARTGWPHTQIAKLLPHDIDYAKRLVRVTGREKGGGTRDMLIPVTESACRALRLMERCEAWGPFSRHSMHKTFTLARDKAIAKWHGIWPAPANLHPYDLRHGFIALALERSGGNLLGVSKLALHSDVSMTAFYAASMANPMALAVRDALSRKVPPESATRTPQTPTVSARKRGSKSRVPPAKPPDKHGSK